MERYFECVECGYEKAELNLKEHCEQKEGKQICITGVPRYLCPRCGEATYLLKVELEVERIIDRCLKNGSDTVCTVGFMEKNSDSGSLNNNAIV